jgi:hypothetical protein
MTSRMNFKNSRSAGNGAHMWKGTTLKVIVTGRPKLVFDQRAAPVPEITDGSIFLH